MLGPTGRTYIAVRTIIPVPGIMVSGPEVCFIMYVMQHIQTDGGRAFQTLSMRTYSKCCVVFVDPQPDPNRAAVNPVDTTHGPRRATDTSSTRSQSESQCCTRHNAPVLPSTHQWHMWYTNPSWRGHEGPDTPSDAREQTAIEYTVHDTHE